MGALRIHSETSSSLLTGGYGAPINHGDAPGFQPSGWQKVWIVSGLVAVSWAMVGGVATVVSRLLAGY